MGIQARIGHVLKALTGRTDPMAAEGLFLEGSVEFELGNLQRARDMFLMAAKLDPAFGGARYNLAATTEKIEGPTAATLRAWEDYLDVAPLDPRQPLQTIQRVRDHVQDLKKRLP